MSGMVIPDAGRVSVLGAGVGGVVTPRGAVGLVPSGDRSFYLRLSGLENLVFFGRLHGLRLHDARRRSNDLLELTGLTDAAQLAVGRYSHGMQRRLAMARALLAEPRVMLVDEATHDLDPEGARRIRALVSAVASRGAAVVWTTQRLEEVRDFADTVTVIHHGQVRFSGGVSAFLARASPRVFVVSLAGSPARAEERAAVAIAEAGSVRERPGDAGQLVLSLGEGVLLGEALVQLVSAGFEIESVREERSAIEDVFLQLTAGDAG
jgi:ABC-2 type transport system ATP-binding protein